MGSVRWLAGLLAVLVAVGAYAFLYSPVFRLERIEVRGNAQIPKDRIIEAVAIGPGEVRWQNPAAEVRQRVLALPLVAEAHVDWRLPGELYIEVTERTPLALLPYYNYFVEVDGSGRLLRLIFSVVETELPVITGVPLPTATLGQWVDHPGLEPALNFVAYLPEQWRREVGEVNIDADQNLTVYGSGGEVVLLGRPSEIDRKAATLVAIWSQARAEAIEVARIDVRSPDNPTVTPRAVPTP